MRKRTVYVDWDGGVFLENNEPHDNSELYSFVKDEGTHVLAIWGYNAPEPVHFEMPI